MADVTLDIRLPKTTIYRMAMDAHKAGVTLNDYVVRVALKAAAEVLEPEEEEEENDS